MKALQILGKWDVGVPAPRFSMRYYELSPPEKKKGDLRLAKLVVGCIMDHGDYDANTHDAPTNTLSCTHVLMARVRRCA